MPQLEPLNQLTNALIEKVRDLYRNEKVSSWEIRTARDFDEKAYPALDRLDEVDYDIAAMEAVSQLAKEAIFVKIINVKRSGFRVNRSTISIPQPRQK